MEMIGEDDREGRRLDTVNPSRSIGLSNRLCGEGVGRQKCERCPFSVRSQIDSRRQRASICPYRVGRFEQDIPVNFVRFWSRFGFQMRLQKHG